MSTTTTLSTVVLEDYPKLDLSNVPSRREALAILNRPVALVHQRAKRMRPDLVQMAIQNEPFGDLSRMVCATQERLYDEGADGTVGNEWYQQLARRILQTSYGAICSVEGIVPDVVGFDDESERVAVHAALSSLRAASLTGQVKELEEQYASLCAFRTVFSTLRKELDFSFETVLPTRFLPELLMAAPVWFIDSKFKRSHAKRPPVFKNPEVTFFCDTVNTRQFSSLFQMYNRLPRKFAEFSGDDVMPAKITDLFLKTREHFDFLVIATPYHDLATKEWRVESWQRNVDPFLFGFLEKLPGWMFFLGRWSGTGLFPLVTDMIADTVDHIRVNQFQLRGLARTSWYGGKTAREMNIDSNGDSLVTFAGQLISAYQQHKLFPFLRDEAQPLKAK